VDLLREDYYGIHPKISSTRIKKMIMEEDVLSTSENLYSFCINELDDLWKSKHVQISHDDFGIPMLAKCLLSMSFFYYLELEFENQEHLVIFERTLEDYSKYSEGYFFRYYSIHQENENKKRMVMRVYGRLPDLILDKIRELGFCYTVKSDNKILVDKTGEEFFGIYNINHYHLLHCVSDSFYSGVNLRVEDVDFSYDDSFSPTTENITFVVSRTTFGTIVGFDGVLRGIKKDDQFANILGHALLEKYSEKLLKIVDRETEITNEFINSIEAHNDMQYSLQKLKTFLKESIYPHYINISGNITTSDGYCLYTRRGRLAVDSMSLYCSVNGVAEVYDDNVNSYVKSLEQDVPSIVLGSSRIDFSGELSRECEAELGISEFSSKWKYYGFSIMGLVKKNFVDTSHFNILGYNYSVASFEDIERSWITANEKLENDYIYGYKYTISNSIGGLLLKKFESFFSFVVNWNESLLFIAYFLFLIRGAKDVGFLSYFTFDWNLAESWYSIIEMIVGLFLITTLFIMIGRKVKEMKKLKKKDLLLVRNFEYENILQRLFKKKELKQSHPIMLVMSSLYLFTKLKKENTNFHS
jgi:hypothetical protein